MAKVTGLGALFVFMLVNLSLIKLRFNQAGIKRVFKVPLNIGKVPLLPWVGIALSILLMAQFGLEAFLTILAIIGSGCLVFYLTKKARSSKVWQE